MANNLDLGQLTTKLESVEKDIAECQNEINNISGKLSDVTFGYNYPNDAPLEVRDNQENDLRSSLQFKETQLNVLMAEKQSILNQISSEVSKQISGISDTKATNPSISKYTISLLQQPINGTVAVCSATFYNSLTINGMMIKEGRKGLYVKMPQKRTKQGCFIDVAHPLSADGRRNINETLIGGYKNGVLKQEFKVEPPKTVAAQNSVKYPPKYGKSLARMDLIVGNMVVHNAKIIEGKDGALRLSLPSYKAKDGNYTSICNPATKEAFKQFSQEAMKEFNTQYSFLKLTDDDVSALKESGINIQSRKNSQGENVVKFKTEDLGKVEAFIQTAPKAAPIIQ